MSAFPMQSNAGPLTKEEAVELAAFKDSRVWQALKRYFATERGDSATRLMDVETGPDKVNWHRGKYASFAFVEAWVEGTLPAEVAAALAAEKAEEEAGGGSE